MMRVGLPPQQARSIPASSVAVPPVHAWRATDDRALRSCRGPRAGHARATIGRAASKRSTPEAICTPASWTTASGCRSLCGSERWPGGLTVTRGLESLARSMRARSP